MRPLAANIAGDGPSPIVSVLDHAHSAWFEKTISVATGETPEPDTSQAPSQEASDVSASRDTSAAHEIAEPEPESDGNSSPEAAGDAPDQNTAIESLDTLSDDQQAALDQIMAEIESKRKSESEESAPESESQTDDDPLPDNQQDALSKRPPPKGVAYICGHRPRI